MSDFELFLPARAWGIPNPSPFCVKLETWLRMAGIPYTARAGNPVKAPRGKLPYATFRGESLADSQVIITRMAKEGYDLDAWLSPADRARGHLIRRTLEEALYFGSLHDRWLIDKNFALVYPVFFGPMGPIAPLISWYVRRKVRAQAHAQGIARYTPEERERMAVEDLDAITAQIGDTPYLFGDKPSTIDASLYGFACQLLWTPFETTATVHAKKSPALVRWAEGIRERHWQEIPPLV